MARPAVAWSIVSRISTALAAAANVNDDPTMPNRACAHHDAANVVNVQRT